MRIGTQEFALIAEGHTPALSGGQVDLTPEFVVDTEWLASADAIFVAPAAGTARAVTFTFASTYVAGDIVRCTLVDNSASRQIWKKTYEYTVQTGDTVTDIAVAIKTKILAEGTECPYTASNSSGVLTVTATQLDKLTLVGYAYTNSAAGTNTYAVSVAGTRKEGQPSDLIDKGIPADNINLSSYDTVVINYTPPMAQPQADAAGSKMKQIFLFLTPGEGSACATLINSL